MPKATSAAASRPQTDTSRLASLVAEFAQGEGASPSSLAGVEFMRSTRCYPRSAIAYEPGIFIVVQGRKTGYLGRRRFVYDANNYLVLTVPLPFECEVEATPEKPLLGLKIGVTPATVAELLMQIEHPALGKQRKRLQAIEAAPLDATLSDCTERLLKCLRSADDARILGPPTVREITYRVLLGPLGHNLRALAAPHTHFGQISRVLNRIHSDYSRVFDVGTLARDVGMSPSTFHAHFKAVTSSSPLQYLKNIRLHKARMLMVNKGVSAGAAATQVGYESASQFSREFKRLFGDGPATAANELRRSLVRLG
ncbi:MAG TPA: AraC family transcriptional regulator [Chthoniobacterales bacterium]